MMNRLLCRWMLAGLLFAACHTGPALTGPAPPVDSLAVREDRGLVAFDAIDEASGLAASRRTPGVLWTHNDSGDGPRLFALSTEGAHLGVATLAGLAPFDWEDLAAGPGPEAGVAYLYVGDIGDNRAVRGEILVHRVPEPPVDPAMPRDTLLADVATFTLRYPDGAHDAETLLVDPLTRDLLIVTKRDTTVTVYRAPFPQSTRDVIMLQPVATVTFDEIPDAGMAFQGAVGGDVSPSGLAVLLKTYDKVYRWQRASATGSLFAGPPTRLPYVTEPQGEAIAWAADESGYFTISEERNDIPARLYFYPLTVPTP